MAKRASYWHSRGKYQADCERLTAKLIPHIGESLYTHGEVLRSASRLYYDLYNNGLINLDSPTFIYFMSVLRQFEDRIKPLMRKDGDCFRAVFYVFDQLLKKFARQHHSDEDEEESLLIPQFYNNVEKLMDAVILYVRDFDVSIHMPFSMNMPKGM